MIERHTRSVIAATTPEPIAPAATRDGGPAAKDPGPLGVYSARPAACEKSDTRQFSTSTTKRVTRTTPLTINNRVATATRLRAGRYRRLSRSKSVRWKLM